MNSIWKRSLSLLLAVVMVVGMVPMSVFATEEEACAHENVEIIDEPADCVWEGYYAEYCNDCGEYLHEEFIPAAGHSWEDNVCTACGETLAVEEDEAEQEEEPAQEEPSEEETEEIAIELTPVEMPVEFALKNNGTLEGIVWLDKNRDNDLMTKVMEGGLRDMILTAVNMADSSEKVYYNSTNGKKDVANLLDLYDMYEELKDVLKGEATLSFTIGSGSSAKLAYVTLKNIAHLTFDVSVPAVEAAGAPEDIKAAVQNALDNAVINVYHGGDAIAWELLPEELCTVDDYNPGNYTWPAATKSAKTNAGITITIRDSVDGTTEMSATANVTLKDTTPVYTVTFMSNGSVYNSYTVIKGQNLPAVEDPERAYYTFGGWDKKVEYDNITEDAVYTALWTPNLDNNGDGIADQLQQFKVTYLVDGNEYESIFHKYGAKTQLPETDPTDPDGERIFLGWGLDDGTEDVAVAETVRDHVTYVAKWAAKEYIIVVFQMDRVGNTTVTQKFAVRDGEQVQELKYDFLDGWYDESGAKFDFDQAITTELAGDDGYLYLTGTLQGYDNGGLAGEMDGTAEDAYANHTFYIYEKDAEGNWGWNIQHEADTEYEQDPATKVEFEEVYLPDAKDNYVKHTGWEEYSYEGTEYAKDAMVIPTVEEDFNNNDIVDTEEAARLTLPADAEVKSSGTLGRPDAVPAEYGITEVPDLTASGTMTTAMGTVSITGMQEDGTFLYNTVDNGRANNAATILVATPAENHYVSKIMVGGQELDLNDEDVAVYDASDDSYTVNLTTLSRPAVMAAETEQTTVEVIFEAAEIKFKDVPELKVGATYTTEEVYDAVVEAPVRNEGDTVVVEYVAREQEEVTVSVKGLRQDIEFRYGEVGKKLMEKMWPGDTVTVTLTEVTKPVTYQHEGMVKTPQQVVDSYILELQDASITQLAGTLTMLQATIQSKLNDKESGAYIRPFLYNADGDLEETIKVTYKGSGRTISGEKTYTLTDDRAETSITVSNKTFKAGQFTDDELLTGAVLNGAEGVVKLADSYAGRNARTYANVPVYFSGNEAAKPSQASFKLTIEKNDVTLELEKLILVEHGDTDYADRAYPKLNPAGVDVISVVAGIDLNELDLDIAKHGDPNAYLKNVKAKAWIKLPENLKAILEWVGEDLSRTYDASELREVLETKAEMLESEYGLTHEAIGKILNLLKKIEETGIYNYADASLGMDVVFTDNVYPTNPGFYVNMAITADPSYHTAYDYGMIVISPVVALPDRGGVQLTYNGRAEHLFALPSDGNAKELTVTCNGRTVDADVYYYGLNANLAVESGTKAPYLPGAYLASTIYTVKNADGSIQKIGSDMAMLVIGMTDVKLDMDSEIVEFDSKFHSPDYTVTTYDGVDVTDNAAVTMISGTVGVDNDDNLDLEDLEASVNISFPNAIHEAWKWFAQEMNAQGKVDVPELNETLSECEITPDTLVDFLEWCQEKLDNNYDLLTIGNRVDALNRWIDQAKIDKVKEYYNNTIDKLLAAANKLVVAANKLNDKIPEEMMKITFEQNKQYKDKGFYLFYGIVTDPDYIPTSDAALMVIKDLDDALVLLDTHTPYDGTGKEPFGWDNTNRDGITFVVDKKAKEVNFLLDNHMKAVIEEIEDEFDVTLDGKKVSELYGGTVDLAEKLVEKICTTIKEKAIDRITSKTPDSVDNIAEDVLNALDDKLAALREKLEGKLTELKDSDVTIRINGALPVNVGTYEFYAYSYSIEVAKAELVIEPIHVRVSIPKDLEKVYDGSNEVTVKPVVSYYSFESIEGQKLQKVEVKRPATVTDAQLNLQYTVTTEGIDVGTYPVKITGATINEVANFAKNVDTEDGVLEILKRDITVVVGENIKVNDDGTITAEAYEKFFGDADPKFHCEIAPEDAVADADGLTFIPRRTEGEDAGEYAVTADPAENPKSGNYNVTYTDSTLTIKPAEIKITIKDADKGFDQDEPEFTYTYEIVNGLDTYDTEKKVREYIDNILKLQISRGDFIDGSDNGKDDPGDTFEIVAVYDPDNKNVNVVEMEFGTLTIGYGDYVCWNTRTEKYYEIVQLALLEAEEGDTVQMLKDTDQTQKTDIYKGARVLTILDGITFDLNQKTVKVQNVAAFNGSHVIDPLRGGVLDVPEMDDVILSTSNSEMALWNGEGYIFGTLRPNITNKGNGLSKTDSLLEYRFTYTMSGCMQPYMIDQEDGNNEVTTLVRLTWNLYNEDGTPKAVAYQNYTYSLSEAATVAKSGHKFLFTLSNYESLRDLTLTAYVVSETGVETFVEKHNIT